VIAVVRDGRRGLKVSAGDVLMYWRRQTAACRRIEGEGSRRRG
jgi:hypothetical protein